MRKNKSRLPLSRCRFPRSGRPLRGEPLEERCLLAALPFGATSEDTAEFMLGEVLVSVVLMESDGRIDPDQESWSAGQIDQVKQRIAEGLDWWVQVLERQQSVHSLSFQLDFTYADQPIATGYEPISRPSHEFLLWIDDFFQATGFGDSLDFSENIRAFNHAQRVRHGTHWAFTIFVVDNDQDEDRRFAPQGDHATSFAYAGGRFFVMTADRPASTVAHETAHIFWALDEYAGSKSYFDHRGYYDTQNLNAFNDNPDPSTRVRSILDSHLAAYRHFEVSPSAREMIGWRDSDGDGIFDVLDVPHQLQGRGSYDAAKEQYHFRGSSSVQTLPNRNSSGTGNDITLNRIRRAEYRLDGGPWKTAATYDADQVQLDLRIPVSREAKTIELRTLDDTIGVASNIIQHDLLNEAVGGWHNARQPLDVNGDSAISPLDALLVINDLNRHGARALSPPPGGTAWAWLDVNGDGFLSAVDALLVINQLNRPAEPVAAAPAAGRADQAEGEGGGDVLTPHASVEIAAAGAAPAETGGRWTTGSWQAPPWPNPALFSRARPAGRLSPPPFRAGGDEPSRCEPRIGESLDAPRAGVPDTDSWPAPWFRSPLAADTWDGLLDALAVDVAGVASGQ